MALRVLPRAALLLSLLLLPHRSAASDLWSVQIDNSPAPSPQDGPPLSRNASRDPSLLKYQILGIAGGYIFFVLFLGSLILTVGRRLRHAAQSSHGTLSMEMVKPSRWMGDPSPIAKSISSFSRRETTPKMHSRAPTQASFDYNVIQSDKDQRDQAMERLYGAVFDQNTKSPKSITSIEEKEAIRTSTTPYTHTRNLSSSSTSFSQRDPPPRLNSKSPQPVKSTTPPSAHAPNGVVEAVYTPYAPMPNDVAAPMLSGGHQPMTSPITYRSNPVSPASTRSKKTRSVRKLTISAPMPKHAYDNDEALTPLSPRNYDPGSPPLAPSRDRPVTPIEDLDDATDEDIIDTYGYEGLDHPRPLPQTGPSRRSQTPMSPKEEIMRGLPHGSPRSAGASTNPLPFRAIAPPTSGATSSVPHRTGNKTVGPTSPPPTKTTMLSPLRENFTALGFTGLNTASALSPYAAGLATPYSPYMPFSPVTPVTPHLTSRAERRQNQRDEGRRVANADEDLVRNDKEMWGDAW